MRRLQPQPKDRVKLPVPNELKDAFTETLELVKQAKRDDDINIDYDDAIQIGPICGGRYAKKPSRFEFTYYPTEKGEKECWNLDLLIYDIEDIADGRMNEITLYKCQSPYCGEIFNKSDGHCSCDYAEDTRYGTFEFPQAQATMLEWGVVGISIDSKKKDVIQILGHPQKVGGGVNYEPIGYIWPWIWYQRDDCQLRFEFDHDDQIRNVSFREKNWVPGT